MRWVEYIDRAVTKFLKSVFALSMFLLPILMTHAFVRVCDLQWPYNAPFYIIGLAAEIKLITTVIKEGWTIEDICEWS